MIDTSVQYIDAITEKIARGRGSLSYNALFEWLENANPEGQSVTKVVTRWCRNGGISGTWIFLKGEDVACAYTPDLALGGLATMSSICEQLLHHLKIDPTLIGRVKRQIENRRSTTVTFTRTDSAWQAQAIV